MTLPAPPPYGVSSTWPARSGVLSRRSIARSSSPPSSAFRTWPRSANQSNQRGNSVKTSIFTSRTPRSASRSIDDGDQDPSPVAPRRGADDRPQGVHRATVSPDHLPDVLLGDAQLVHDRSV